ncbi:MAG: hypothetical protein PHH08_01925 [Candidatus ainarchaeum sp.]|nr:hypothetical protein [Candidatus ainarchaeum sp.]
MVIQFLADKTPAEREQIRAIFARDVQRAAKERRNAQALKTADNILEKLFNMQRQWEVILAKDPSINRLMRATRGFFEEHNRVPTILELAGILKLPAKAVMATIREHYRRAFVKAHRASMLGRKKTKPIGEDKKSE